MSREADFMQRWQQRLIDERGGADGQNYDNLLQASREAHEGTNPSKRTYNEVRTVRAVVTGAVGFETACQNELLAHSSESLATPRSTSSDFGAYTPLPQLFKDLANDYQAAFLARAQQDASEPPSPKSSAFTFYEGAQAEFIDHYWQKRLEAGDLSIHSAEEIEQYWEQSKNLGNAVLGLFSENLQISLDILVALGISLCLAKRRPCRAEELSEYVIDNIDAATALTSVRRKQRSDPAAKVALPVGYGYEVLQGDTTSLHHRYITATQESSGKYRAQWRHPSLRKGSWSHSGHCPASDQNRLRARTDNELRALKVSLGTVGLEHLIAQDGLVTTAQLVIAKALDVAQASAYQDTEWQKRALSVE